MSNETQLVKSCLQYLALSNIMAWRNNTGGVEKIHKGKRRFIRFGRKGASDIFAILPHGRFLAIECKRGRNKPTREQQEFINDVNATGALAVVVYEVDELIQILQDQ